MRENGTGTARAGRTAGYVRWSDRDVLRAAEAALAACGVLPGDMASDRDRGPKSGAPGLRALLAGLAPGDAVAVRGLWDLGRSLRGALRAAADIRRRGATLVLADRGADTGGPCGPAVLAALDAFADLDAELARAETRAGVAAGRRGGRRATYGDEQILEAARLLRGGATMDAARASATAPDGKAITATQLRRRLAAAGLGAGENGEWGT